MKKLFTLILLLYGLHSYAQLYNNEWIDFSKTYYKFKSNRTGLLRIPQATLAANGLGAIPAQQFKLWRNGQEVTIYTSSATGALPVNGYIEFWAQANDGKPDRPLYRDPLFQHTDKTSLQTDTAVYFLTADAVSVNQRFADVPNNVAANVLAPEPYFMYTAGRYFNEQINSGFAAVIGEYVYSSSYDKGEYWSTRDIYPGTPKTDPQASLYPYLSGPAGFIKFGASGNALNTRNVQVKINNTLVKDTICDYFNDVVGAAAVPVSLLTTGTADISFINSATTVPVVANDRMVVSFYELTYPRQFNFDGAANFSFTLPATNTGYFLQITNFNYGGTPPVLYDLSYHQKYTGDISAPGIVKFAITPGAAERNLILVNEESANYTNVNAADVAVKTFTNFNNVANQANYLIISDPLLYHASDGSNPVDQYKNYRTSVLGGGFNAKVFDIDELVDQFAFGIKKHPLSVKNFLRFARAKFAAAPQFAFLIGHGVAYNAYRANISNPLADKLNIVPAFGWPASDNLLASADGASPLPITPIGRLSAVTGDEVANYLEKMKEYENAQKTNGNTIAERAWMKNVMQVTGASEVYLGSVLCNYMDNYHQIIEDTLMGAYVVTVCKSTSAEVEQLSNDRITAFFNNGLGFFCYFGHSSSSTLGFNIDDPQNYNNTGRYPVFSVNGCNAGDFFVFDPQRFSVGQTLSEKFVFTKQKGSIAFLASTHFGIVNYLNIFITGMYSLISKADYGASMGKINRDAAQQMLQVSGFSDFYARLTAEEMTLHGDPALKLNSQPLPDYDIEEPQVVINPQFISIAENKFTVNMKLYNLGKAINDSIVVEIKRQYPDNSIVTLARKKIKGIYYADSLSLDVPIIATRDKGLNKLIITVDADNAVTEMTEANNTITKEFYIYEDEARPAYPYDFSIISQLPVKLYASTANPLSTLKQYAMEIDTTELFNSSLKVNKTISSVGGLLEFDPGISLHDSTVYYWRTSLVPASGGVYHWNTSSFIYLAASSQGFNQSHYYQHAKSTLERMTYSAGTRTWAFDAVINNVFLKNGVYPTYSSQQASFENSVNNNIVLGAGCNYNELIFQVLSPGKFQPWQNNFSGGTGLYNSLVSTCGSNRQYNFDFLLNSSVSRKRMMDFIDSIPTGAYVIVRSNSDPSFAGNTYSDVWKSDTALFGSGNSLYHKLLNQGFSNIDSFNAPRAFIFMFKKNAIAEFNPVKLFSISIYDGISKSVDCEVPDTLGYMTSPVFGPAKLWKTVHWKGTSIEAAPNDNPTVNIIGITAAGTEDVLYTLNQTMQDFDISGISAVQYPNLKLKMRNIDSVTQTPYQLSYWRIDYDPVPEGAVIPNIYIKTKSISKAIDTLDIGEKFVFGLAFKNISLIAFDSMKVKMYVLDQNNVLHNITLPKQKPLIAGDSIQVNYEIDTKDFPGLNTVYIEFNPDNSQPEEYHFNNFLYRNFYVKPDKTNPLLDVTFDNVHILNRDIVSAKPHIQIKLKDEAKYLLLTDTAAMVLQVKFPDNTIHTYRFNTDTLRFTPAASASDNTATIDFMPQFLDQVHEDGDEYQLIVKGKDVSGNTAGAAQYTITFRIISKPMVSNLLNYPNPFTTSTAFVFTITGSEIPDNIKIQILTVTGKVVREVTKQELGPLHIGRNITDYKWDGNDQFGQRLANGVYLYRFVTTLSGKKMDKFTDSGDNTDKFFTRGYGKMYLMR
jgi:hypothetical protein